MIAAAAAALALSPLGLTDCHPIQGVRQCSGLVTSWDGVPLDTTVTLPAKRSRGLPLVAEVNGFGNSKYEYLDPASQAYTGNAFTWARDGYAVLTATARGEWGSCGTPEARAASPTACLKGYIHLADTRYEVRDTQTLIGKLVDDGTADPKRIGVTGDSYGGGQSITMAALGNRIMEPDGKLAAWRSPRGVPLKLAAAAPVIPWTNLVYAIAPNGRTPAVGTVPAASEINPVGVFKTTVANAIFAASQFATGPGQPIGDPFVPGRPEGFLTETDPEADVASWVARSDQGEPYDDAGAKAIVTDLVRYHDAVGIAHPHPPPLYVAAGFTDDIFPVDETLRFAHRIRHRAPISLFFGDIGHQRAANKAPDRARMLAAIHAWFDHYVRGAGGHAPPAHVVAMTQTCPRSQHSEGPFRARSFARLARGAVRFTSAPAKSFTSLGASAQVGAAIDPVAGGGDGCAQTDAADQANTPTYRLPVATGSGWLLLGAPRITAHLDVTGARPQDAQVAARLWDVAPDGMQRLVARGVYRPTGGATDRWYLHANGWRFAAGHVPKLELLGNDAPYGRPSNGTFTITVSRLRLRLPRH